MRAKEFEYLLRNIGSMKKTIVSRNDDFPQWYQDVITAADLAENGPARGSMIIKPYGYAIWEVIQSELNERIKNAGVPNMYFPMFIPEGLLNKEANHIEGFAPEVAVVTHAGGKELEEKLIVRPTSETIIYDSFSKWIQSYRDLPLMINQWANVVRWEMRPRLFLRTTEFLWQEGHTAHATETEADTFARQMLELYKDVAENIMAISVVDGEKSERERFAGAAKTYTLESMMQDGKALQFATSHNLGDNFAKVFDVNFSAEDGTVKPVWQTSWGMSTRSIGGLIMSHSDDKGLVLPPRIAPLKVVITTVGGDNQDVKTMADKIAQDIQENVLVDDRDMSPGEKFYAYEKRGVPIRIEIGPRDLDAKQVVLVMRDTGEKKVVAMSNVATSVTQELATMQERLFAASQTRQKTNMVDCQTEAEAVKAIQGGKFALVNFEVDNSLEDSLKKDHAVTVRCYPFDHTGKTLLAKAY